MKRFRFVNGPGLRLAGTAVVLIGLGCLLLTVLDGWIGVLVWGIAAPAVAALIELRSRRDTKPQRPDRPRPTILLGKPRRAPSRTRKSDPPPRFVWHTQRTSGGGARRRSR